MTDTNQANAMTTLLIQTPEPGIKEAKFGGYDAYTPEQMYEIVNLANSRIASQFEELVKVRKESAINAQAHTDLLVKFREIEEELAGSRMATRMAFSGVSAILEENESLRGRP